MKQQDIEYCAQVLKASGDELLLDFHTGATSRSVSDMIQRFQKVNDAASGRIKTALKARFPDIPWVDAEFCDDENQDMTKGTYWLCDPLDGALNFLQGLPFWSMSLCLIQSGKPSMSMVYDPCHNELFHATQADGAFSNRCKISVSTTAEVGDAIFATAHATFVRKYQSDTVQTGRDILQLLPNCQGIRMLGTVSLQLAYVASGRFDGYWEHGFDMYDWWAGAFLVQQAGGVVTNRSNQPFSWQARGIVATNALLSEKLNSEFYCPT